MFKKNTITTIGSTMRDVFIYTDAGVVIPNTGDMLRAEWVAFERAAKLDVKKMVTAYGGGAANTAVAFARFGLKPSILTAVGDDAAGLDAMMHLRREGVSLSHVQHVKRAQTGTSIILNISEQMSQVALVHRGASASLHISQAVVKGVNSQWIYLSALGGAWKQPLEAIMHRVKLKRMKLAWNPGAEQIAAGLRVLSAAMQHTEIFLVNHDEALELAKGAHLVKGPTSARTLARMLSRYGAHATVVTDGHKGAYLHMDKRTWYQPAKLGKTVNKTGAGDAFGSGLVAGVIRFNDMKRALKLAAYNSHSVVGSIGAETGLLHVRDIQRLKI